MSTLKQHIFSLANRTMGHHLEDTLVVVGSPRSGTTWLAEVLRELPGYKQLDEPLNLNSNPEAAQRGFQWRTCIAPGQCPPEAEAYIERALTGGLDKLWLWRFQSSSAPGKLLEHVRRRKIVVKLVRANRMLHWFAERFAPRGIFFIVRHPCAVVSSMLKCKHWRLDELGGQSFREQVLESWIPDAVVKEFAPVLDSISTATQRFAAMWCLDQYFPFYGHASGRYPWVLVPYERLVADGKQELERILSFIGEEPSARMEERLGVASHSASTSLASNDAQQQLSKWKKQLDPKQVDDILRIVEGFGLDFYTDDPHPDYDRLMQFQRTDAAPVTYA